MATKKTTRKTSEQVEECTLPLESCSSAATVVTYSFEQKLDRIIELLERILPHVERIPFQGLDAGELLKYRKD